MRILILALSVLMFSSASYACKIQNTIGLSYEQVQELKIACETAKLKAASEKTNVPFKGEEATPEKITEWASVASGIAEAIGVAATKLNVAVNDFVASPAGFITIFLVAWHIMSNFFVGLFMLFFINIIGFKLFTYARRESVLDVDGKPVLNAKGKPLYKLSPLTVRDRYGDENLRGMLGFVLAFMFIGNIVSFVVMS